MSARLQVSGHTGDIRKIRASQVKAGGKFKDAWEHPESYPIGDGEYLGLPAPLPERECLLIRPHGNVTLTFLPDVSRRDGQGLVKFAFSRPYKMKVISVPDNPEAQIYAIKAKFFSITDNIQEIFNNPDRVKANVNYELEEGEYVLCGRNDTFSVKITIPTEGAIVPPRIIAMLDCGDFINDVIAF